MAVLEEKRVVVIILVMVAWAVKVAVEVVM